MQILEQQIESILLKTQRQIQLTIVQGKAGCGKSTLIKSMTARLTETLGSQSYLLVAPTGSAALNINGNTIHSALHLPARASHFKPLEGNFGVFIYRCHHLFYYVPCLYYIDLSCVMRRCN
jgi:energy-coupling factor transporter ATP-binding protein EcfA2